MSDQIDRDEDQCPSPGCILEADHPGDHEVDTGEVLADTADPIPESGLSVLPAGMTQTETGMAEPAEPYVFDPDADPGDEPAQANEAEAVVAMATVDSYTVRTASNGVNITAGIAVDAVNAGDFEELIGEQTYRMKVGTGRDQKDCGQCQVDGVSTKRDPSNKPLTKVSLRWSASERSAAKRLEDFVGSSVRVELWPVQLPIFGARA